MRFLKKKIALANAHRVHHQARIINEDNSKKVQKLSCVSEPYRATKNIVKNYGRAISSFALSNLALPYLDVILEREGLSIHRFTQYIRQIKGSIDGLSHFRSTILVGRSDGHQLAANKRAFMALSEVFIKYFSVNWIYNSRVLHKEAHLKFRFKMLRRIHRPDLFTYLKGKN